MPSSKADETWTEPEGVVCRLYNSGLVKFGVNLGCPKDMVPSTKRMLAKSAVEAVRTHKDIAFLAAYAASVASAQPMWPSESIMLASASASSVVFRQQRQVHRRAGAAQERAARFMHSQSSVRGDYKSRNLGSRNGAVRDVSYAAATQSVLSVCLLPVLSPVCLSVCLSVSATLLLWIHGWIDYTNAQRSPLEYGAYA